MTCMTIPERISEFLTRRQGRMYCDSCIQERLGLKWRQQVQLITATLAVTPAFKRELDQCCTCNEHKQVVQAVKAPSPSSLVVERPLALPNRPGEDSQLFSAQRLNRPADGPLPEPF